MATVSTKSLQAKQFSGKNATKAQMIEEERISKVNIRESSPVSSPDLSIDRGLRQPHFVIHRSYSHTLKYITTVLGKVIIR